MFDRLGREDQRRLLQFAVIENKATGSDCMLSHFVGGGTSFFLV